MHVLLEGVVPKELALFIYYCIDVKNFFTLAWLNNQLATFAYSYLEAKDKPEPIQKSHYYRDLKIKQTSASILTMCGILPYIFSKKVPHDDTKLKTLLLLFQITHLCTSPCATIHTATELRYLIMEHHKCFQMEYPMAKFTPKMHYMLHLPDQILLFGPARLHWCMRFEAKHAQFTSIKWRNFRNLPKSLITKHQKWLCSQMLSPTGNMCQNYLYEGDTVSGGSETFVEQLFPKHRDILLEKFPDITSIYNATTVIIHGNMFKPGCVLTLGYDEENFPKFAWLADIYVHEHRKYFLCKKIEITDIVHVVNSYEIDIMEECLLLTYEDLFMKMPLTIHFFQNRTCICNKYGHLAIFM